MAMERELLRHVRKKPATVVYPFEKFPSPAGLRGRHIWHSERCIGCTLCVQVCPAFAIELDGRGKDVKGIKFFLHKCVFCAQCEEVCHTHSIELTTEHEIAGYNLNDVTLTFTKQASKPDSPREKKE